MTLTFHPRRPSRRQGVPSAVTEQFGGQGPGDWPAQPQRLCVQQIDRMAGCGIGPLDPGGQIAHDCLVDAQLAVRAEFDDQPAKQEIVGRQQRHHWHRAQPRLEIAQFNLERRRRNAGRDQNGSVVIAEAPGKRDDGHNCVVYGVVERTEVAAGAVLAVTAAQLGGALGPRIDNPGVHGLGALVEARPFIAELAERGVRAAVFEGAAVG